MLPGLLPGHILKSPVPGCELQALLILFTSINKPSPNTRSSESWAYQKTKRGRKPGPPPVPWSKCRRLRCFSTSEGVLATGPSQGFLQVRQMKHGVKTSSHFGSHYGPCLLIPGDWGRHFAAKSGAAVARFDVL